MDARYVSLHSPAGCIPLKCIGFLMERWDALCDKTGAPSRCATKTQTQLLAGAA